MNFDLKDAVKFTDAVKLVDAVKFTDAVKLADMKDPLPSKIPPQQVIVVGASLTAIQLTNRLYHLAWNPLLVYTNTFVYSYFDCRDKPPKTDTMLEELHVQNIQITRDNWILSIEYNEKEKCFTIQTQKEIYTSWSVVICSDAEIKLYGPLAKTHRGLFVCDHSRNVVQTLDDVSLFLKLRLMVSEASEAPEDAPQVVDVEEPDKRCGCVPVCC